MKILFLGEPDSANTKAWIAGMARLGCEVVTASVRVPHGSAALPLGPSRLPPRLRLLLGGRDLERIIKETNPDILIAYRVTSYGWLAARSGFHPLVVAAQNERIVDDEGSLVRSLFLSRCARLSVAKADLIHAWSPNVLEGLKKFGDCEARTLVMHRGIDTSVFNTAVRRPHGEGGAVRIVSTRSLCRIYAVNRLVEAFASVAAGNPSFRLDIAGDGPEKASLEALSLSLGVKDQVAFHGRLGPEQVASLLRDSDLYVSLTPTEGLSSSLLEACACGAFPIVRDIPASRCVVDDASTGLLLKDGSKEELSNALKEAIAKPELRRAAATANAAKVASLYDRDRNLSHFISQYRELSAKLKKSNMS